MDLLTCDTRISKCLDNLAGYPSLDNYSALAWAYRDLLAFLYTDFDEDNVADCLDCIELLSFRDIQFNSSVLGIVLNMLSNKRYDISSLILDRFFHFVISQDFQQGSPLYYLVFKSFLARHRHWRSFDSFCYWWDFSNFKDSDFISPNDQSIACRAYEAFARRLVKTSDLLEQNLFFSDFAKRVPGSAFSIYANFHFAQYLIFIKFDSSIILRVLRPYIKLKFHKPWSWIVVADVFPISDVRHKACLFFALDYASQFSDFVKESVYCRLADFMRQTGDVASCKYFLSMMKSINSPDNGSFPDGFAAILRSPVKMSAPDLSWNYRQICHDIFVNVSDADDNLWLSLSEMLLDR